MKLCISPPDSTKYGSRPSEVVSGYAEGEECGSGGGCDETEEPENGTEDGASPYGPHWCIGEMGGYRTEEGAKWESAIA